MLLLTGGFNPNGALASAEVFEPNASAFVQVGSMHAGRLSHTATLLQNGEVLNSGRREFARPRRKSFPSAELYDQLAGQFSTAASMTTSR